MDLGQRAVVITDNLARAREAAMDGKSTAFVSMRLSTALLNLGELFRPLRSETKGATWPGLPVYGWKSLGMDEEAVWSTCCCAQDAVDALPDLQASLAAIERAIEWWEWREAADGG